jgi:hypothetical protein
VKLCSQLTVLLLLATPVSAGPLADAAARQYPAPGHYTTAMHSPALFWTGTAIVAGGALAVIAAQTFAQESDLSLEDPNTRLGRDLAPCGTDPGRTRMPVADCKTNTGLLVFGIMASAGGGVLMAWGGQRVQIYSTPTRVGFRVRW